MRSPTSLAALGAALASSFAGRVAPVVEPAPIVIVAPAPPAAPAVARPAVAWAEALPEVRFVNTRTGVSCAVRLYADDGSLDDAAAVAIDTAAAERDTAPRTLDRRVLRLIVKAAAHFRVREVDLVSTIRDSARDGSRHRSGAAIDFRLPGVPAAQLAEHLRGNACVGVGLYTNRRTQFVHLDVRGESFYWVDASPPGRVWRESPLHDRSAPARDTAFRPEQDLPE